MSARIQIAAVVSVLALSAAARADITYQNENWPPSGSYEIFNNSQGTETEDCWVANSFTAVTGATHIAQIQFAAGSALSSQAVTVTLYTGTSLTGPAGLSRIVATTTTTNVTATAGSLASVNLASPADLSVGQIFWAAVLIRGVPGSFFPFASDHNTAGASPTVLGHSFFDVGATQGAAYNLDVTGNATVLGGNHPVVSEAQSAGNAVVRAISTPAPGTSGLLGLLMISAARRRRS